MKKRLALLGIYIVQTLVIPMLSEKVKGTPNELDDYLVVELVSILNEIAEILND